MIPLLHGMGWLLLLASLMAYLAPVSLRARITTARAICAAGGAALAVAAYPLGQALLFATGFIAFFACIGPVLTRRGAAAAMEGEASS